VRNEAASIVVTSARPQLGSRKCLMSWRLRMAVLTVTCWVTALAGVEAGQRAADGTADAARGSATLRVCLDVSPRTTHAWVDITTMKKEVARIWQSNGVEVVYPTTRGDTCTVPTARTVLLVLADRPEDLPERLTGSTSPAALGATVDILGVPTHLALAYAHRAVAVALATPACSGAPSRCVSRLLGRVAAHELGHVLLRTTAHSDEGLMRPMFGMEDALAAPGDAYLLAADERDRVARHLRERRGGASETEVASSR
jgi:hypothetical protein